MKSDHLLVVALCVAAAVLAGCGVRISGPSLPAASVTATESGPPESSSNFGPPFETDRFGRSTDTTTLAAELARFDKPPSLPATEVVGASDGAYAGKKKHPQGIWVHYPTGIYLSIQREPYLFDAKKRVAEADARGSRHPDGTPYVLLESLGGRDTMVVTAGEIVDRNGQSSAHAHDSRNVLVWSQDGWNYSMMPNGPRPASLDLLRAAAASIP